MKHRILCACLLVVMLWSFVSSAYGQCSVIQQGTFVPQNKKVKLVARHGHPHHKAIFFRTSLRVNTDGAPNSYHPRDLKGTVKAINNICNGVEVKRNGVRLDCATVRQVFREYQANNFTEPPDTVITWQNVIAATTDATGRQVPCVFQSGDFAGYFGSLTTLKNGLTGEEAGECGHLNQLDQRHIPAFVLPGGQNIVKTLGAGIGDLLMVLNPENNVVSVAVVGDLGPPDKLGEGSVGLNMTLLGRTEQPKTYQHAMTLDTDDSEMLVAIIPNSRTFNPQTPFTKENIADRVEQWLTHAGFGSQRNFVDFMKSCSD